MLSQDQVQQAVGADAYGPDGDKIGKVGQIFLDDQTGEPVFATVNTGLFGMSENFVPISDASYSGDRFTLPFGKDRIKDAPSINPDDGHLSPDEEQRLYEYYGVAYSDSDQTSGTDYSDTDTSTDTREVSDRTDSTDDAMTRSEEQLQVGTQTRETGRARLRKYVETEQVNVSVPVRKEKAVLEREPITDSNYDEATDGPLISEEDHEVTLSEEVPVVDKEVKPVERVRLTTETEVHDETVSDEVRKERIDSEGDVGYTGTTDTTNR
ncbi:MAG: YsnF/AvaK domain-containing protein [Nocardioidaceae bacterium]|nr:YsnF/AvaK domain-containing protein [Nocardioidaceae bacterium]